MSDFDNLMNARDKIMHAADVEILDGVELRKIYKSVEKFCYFVDAHIAKI
jgi:hypothetical protein